MEGNERCKKKGEKKRPRILVKKKVQSARWNRMRKKTRGKRKEIETYFRFFLSLSSFIFFILFLFLFSSLLFFSFRFIFHRMSVNIKMQRRSV